MQELQQRRSPFKGRDLAILSLGEFGALGSGSRVLSDVQARYLLEFSLLAPSSHNTVPQAYCLGAGDTCAVYLRREFVLEASDPTGEEALISVGCAVEAFAIAAAAYGVECEWRPAPSLSWGDVSPGRTHAPVPVHIGTLFAKQGSAAAKEGVVERTLSALLARQVVRAEYDRNLPLPGAVASALEVVTARSGVRLAMFHTSAQKFAWAKLDEMALKHKLEEDPFRIELGRWLLPNGDVTSTRGMRGHEFGLDDRLALELSAQLRGDAALESDQLAFLARASRVGLVSSSALGVLSTRDDTPESAVQVGRAFQRAAVTIVQHGFSCAVHTAVCQVPHARCMAQATLLSGIRPKLIFRLGKPLNADHERRPRSSRPPLDELLLPRDFDAIRTFETDAHAYADVDASAKLPMLHRADELLSRLASDPSLPGRTADETETLTRVAVWARDFLARPHPELGRPGHVCPWVEGSIQRRLLLFTLVHGASESAGEMEATMRRLGAYFLELEPKSRPSSQLKGIVVVLPDLTETEAPDVVNAIHQRLKPSFVAQGMMLGEFFSQNPKSGLHNVAFRPLRSDPPLLVIRPMVLSDIVFLSDSPVFIRGFIDTFGAPGCDEIRSLVVRRKDSIPNEHISLLLSQVAAFEGTGGSPN